MLKREVPVRRPNPAMESLAYASIGTAFGLAITNVMFLVMAALGAFEPTTEPPTLAHRITEPVVLPERYVAVDYAAWPVETFLIHAEYRPTPVFQVGTDTTTVYGKLVLNTMDVGAEIEKLKERCR